MKVILCIPMIILYLEQGITVVAQNNLGKYNFKDRSPDVSKSDSKALEEKGETNDPKFENSNSKGLVSGNEPQLIMNRPFSWGLENLQRPNYYQYYFPNSYISPENFIYKRDVGQNVGNQFPYNGSQNSGQSAQPYSIINPVPRDQMINVQNIQPSHMLTRYESGGEIDNENFEHVGIDNLYPSRDVNRDMMAKNNIKVHCVKAGREEVICSHGDFTYRISLPEQFMNQDTVEGLVSSIYNNIELGRHSPFGVPGGNGYLPSHQVPNQIRESSFPMSKQSPGYVRSSSVVGGSNPYSYNFIGNSSSQMPGGSLVGQDSKSQVIRLSIPIESQSNLINGTNFKTNEIHGNEPVHISQSSALLQPKMQTNNFVAQPGSQGAYSSGQVPNFNNASYNLKNSNTNQQSNIVNYSNVQQNSPTYSGSTILRQENTPPLSINIIPNSNNNMDHSNAYSSKWYAKRSGDQMKLFQPPQELSLQGQSLPIYLTKRDAFSNVGQWLELDPRNFNFWKNKYEKTKRETGHNSNSIKTPTSINLQVTNWTNKLEQTPVNYQNMNWTSSYFVPKATRSCDIKFFGNSTFLSPENQDFSPTRGNPKIIRSPSLENLSRTSLETSTSISKL